MVGLPKYSITDERRGEMGRCRGYGGKGVGVVVRMVLGMVEAESSWWICDDSVDRE